MRAAKEKRRGSAAIVWILTSFVVVFVLWAKNAPLDEIVRGPGVLIPASKNQVVQSLEGGILESISVGEGDIVEQRQILAHLSETRYQADVSDLEGQILAIEAKLLRLYAEVELVSEFRLPVRFRAENPELTLSEEKLFNARMAQHQSAVVAAQEQADLQAERVSLMRDMVDRNAMPALELLNAETAESEARAAHEALLTEYQLIRSEEISELLAEIERLRAQVEQSRDQLSRATLLSPVKGIVNTLYVTTVGGVVQPGEPIFEITPLDDELLVEVEILPKDIAFVAVGMPSTVKLTAYDYTVYGSLKGKVAQISADTFEDETSADGTPYYRVIIQVDPASWIDKEDVFEVRPGMLAEAELHVGEKTVMQYLLKPLVKSSEALREP